MKKLKNKKEEGITLVALVITIVVLIVLATISINVVVGENGIIAQARQAGDVQKKAEAKDEESLQLVTDYIDVHLKGWDNSKVNAVKSEDNITVPVPKGYTASTVDGEKSVSTGFVIKEGKNGGATSGVNEFVWVPVSNISDIYDEANKAGQLWNFGTSSSPKNPATKRTYPTTKNTGNREPDVITDASYGSDSTSGNSCDAVLTNLQQAGLSSTATAGDFKAQLQSEFDQMIKSVKKYGGFYIGRYETGNLNSTKAVVQKNNTNISNQTWYTMYKLCKTIKDKDNDNVTTSMLWGCQWDATMRWMQTSTNSDVANFPTNSEGKGNYEGTQGSKNKVIPTGSNSSYAVNNIYDMAGNVYDWTIEAVRNDVRVLRGGFYLYKASDWPASFRNNTDPTSSSSNTGCRSTLYIK